MSRRGWARRFRRKLCVDCAKQFSPRGANHKRCDACPAPKAARSPSAVARQWRAVDDARLRDLYPRTLTAELPALLGRSRSAIKNRAAAMHLKKNADVNLHRPWTRRDDALLRARYSETGQAELCGLLGRTVSSIYGRATKLGLNKTDAFKAKVLRELGVALNVNGFAHRFRKGQVPPNKGLRRPGYGPGRMKQTQFKKGQRGSNWKPIGATQIMDGYQYTKIRDRMYVPYTVNWKATHVLLWEKHHGRRVPKGHLVVFKNRDKTDIRLENLELLTRRQNMLRNTVHNLPAPLPQTIQLLGALKRKINRRTRDHEEQNRRSA